MHEFDKPITTFASVFYQRYKLSSSSRVCIYRYDAVNSAFQSFVANIIVLSVFTVKPPAGKGSSSSILFSDPSYSYLRQVTITAF